MKKYILFLLIIASFTVFAGGVPELDTTKELSDDTAGNISTGLAIALAALGLFGGGAAVIAWVSKRFSRFRAFTQTVVALMDGLHETFKDGRATAEELKTNYAQWQKVKEAFSDLIGKTTS